MPSNLWFTVVCNATYRGSQHEHSDYVVFRDQAGDHYMLTVDEFRARLGISGKIPRYFSVEAETTAERNEGAILTDRLQGIFVEPKYEQ